MRTSTFVTLFASSVLAQESATVFNLFPFKATLTALGTSSGTTTYKNSCASDSAGISVIPTEYRPTPTPTAKPHLRRQAQSTSDAEDFEFCEPYTLIQGSSTYGFHMTDPVPGAWTVDVACNWQGALTTADLTCIATENGYAAAKTDVGMRATVFKGDDVKKMELLQTVAVVRASAGSAAVSVSASPTGSSSGSGTATKSTGLAPARPLPTGGMALVGGVVGVLAAALAL